MWQKEAAAVKIIEKRRDGRIESIRVSIIIYRGEADGTKEK